MEGGKRLFPLPQEGESSAKKKERWSKHRGLLICQKGGEHMMEKLHIPQGGGVRGSDQTAPPPPPSRQKKKIIAYRVAGWGTNKVKRGKRTRGTFLTERKKIQRAAYEEMKGVQDR